MENKKESMKKGMDLKRLVLCFQKKLWLFIMLTVVGASLGGIIYQVVRAMHMPVSFEAVSKLYISFGVDESGEIYQYYNGYTWNELLDTEPIVTRIMENLPGEYSREEVIGATKAEILSDIRLLTVTVEGGEEKFVREIQEAAETGLMNYAKDSEELKRIEVIRSEQPKRVYWDDRTVTACVAGGSLFAVITLLVMAFFYVLDEAVYVQEDIEKSYPYKALGLLTRNQKGLQPYARELKANVTYALGEKKKFALLDMGNHGDVRKLEMERILNMEESDFMGGSPGTDELTWSIPHEKNTKHRARGSQEAAQEEREEESGFEAVPFQENVMSHEECKLIRELGGVVILLPFGEDTGRKLSRILSLLKNQDCRIYGMVIAQADEEFLNRYYG